jgi:hypothetical protein
VNTLQDQNLKDVGEMSMLSALARKQTRRSGGENFSRADCPEERKDMDRFLILQRKDGLPDFCWREPRGIDQESFYKH